MMGKKDCEIKVRLFYELANVKDKSTVDFQERFLNLLEENYETYRNINGGR